MKSFICQILLILSIFLPDNAYSSICILDISGRNSENENSGSYSRQVYSATYLCDVAGYNYIVTDSLPLAMKEKFILMSSNIVQNSFNTEEWAKISEWVKSGGTFLVPGIRSVAPESQEIISQLFGIDATMPFTRSANRMLITWNPDFYQEKELEYIDEENERTTSIGKITSYSFTPTICDILATYSNGDTAVARHEYGKGRVYLAGINWRDVVQRNQLNKDQNASRQYNNGFEPSSDVWALFLRSAYAKSIDLSVWKFTVPAGFTQLLIPTHDCDSRTAYDEMHSMSEYEKSLGLSSHYFLTTHYFSDKVNFGHSYLSDFYNSETIPKALQLLEDGHTIGSHSICHFPDFNKTSNTDTVTREEYALRATCVDEVSTGASTWAEIVLSKQILEEDLGNHVRSFRSGHLCVNSDFHSMLEEGDYAFQSCYTGGDLLSEFPFFGRIGNTWNQELSTVLTMPLHISDVYNNKDGEPLNNDTWITHRAVDDWQQAMQKLRGNYASAILLIHPNRDWKMTMQKMLIERLDSAEVGLYNFEDYGDFWLTRLSCEYSYDYDTVSKSLVITTDLEKLKESRMTFGIETSDASINSVTVCNADGTESYPALLRQLTASRYLAIPEFPVSDTGVEEIRTDHRDQLNEKGSIVDLNGRTIAKFLSKEESTNFLKTLPSGIYIIKGSTWTRKVRI